MVPRWLSPSIVALTLLSPYSIFVPLFNFVHYFQTQFDVSFCRAHLSDLCFKSAIILPDNTNVGLYFLSNFHMLHTRGVYRCAHGSSYTRGLFFIREVFLWRSHFTARFLWSVCVFLSSTSQCVAEAGLFRGCRRRRRGEIGEHLERMVIKGVRGGGKHCWMISV